MANNTQWVRSRKRGLTSRFPRSKQRTKVVLVEEMRNWKNVDQLFTSLDRNKGG